MIQRKQTLFILAAVILSIACLCLPIGTFGDGGANSATEYNLWMTNEAGQKFFTTWPLFAILVPSAALGAYTIFLYHNRIVQARLCSFNMLLLIGWYIVFSVFGNLLGGDASGMSFTPSWASFLPAFAIILYFMARKAILADEKLVRAADRIR